MDNEAIEFHDSVLARADRSGDEVRLLFEPGYVHRSSGDPARDAGTGWSVNAELTVFGAVGYAQPSGLPSDVWEGALRVGDRDFDNVVPIPLSEIGKVHLEIELTSGEILKVSGNRVVLSIIGPYEFVENVPAG